MSHDPVVQPAALERLRNLGGEKLLRQIVRLYLENAAERLRQIDSGLAPDGSLGDAGAGAHALKSSAANVGADRVSRLAAELEEAAHEGDVERARAIHESLPGAQADVEAVLTRLLGEEER